MDNEKKVRCVPVEMLDRLNALADRLWSENSPCAVHLGAILEEFSPDVKALGQIVTEYEADFNSKLESRAKEFTRKEASHKEKTAALSARIEALEAERAALLAKEAELRKELSGRDTQITAQQEKAMEEEREINLRYVSKMQELYDRTNSKEMDLLAKWEEKNRQLDSRLQALERDFSERVSQLELRERALEEDSKARKAELIRTFDKIKAGLDARESALASREKALSYWEKTGSPNEGEK